MTVLDLKQETVDGRYLGSWPRVVCTGISPYRQGVTGHLRAVSTTAHCRAETSACVTTLPTLPFFWSVTLLCRHSLTFLFSQT